MEREQLRALAPPIPATSTHFPIPHHDLVRQTVEQLEAIGVTVDNESHGVSHAGNRYFGVFGLGGGRDADGYGLIIGLRNSHDRSYRASLALGTRVFVCDNLSFSGEITIERKHTRWILRDLPGLMTEAIGRIVAQRCTMEERVACYRQFQLSDEKASHLMIKSLDSGIVAANKLPLIVSEWQEPKHAEFEPRTAWSLFNAFTECLKGYTADSMYARSQPLYGVFDAACGLAAAPAAQALAV
jgi:hypothetical protein